MIIKNQKEESMLNPEQILYGTSGSRTKFRIRPEPDPQHRFLLVGRLECSNQYMFLYMQTILSV